jgi:cytoskeleton protein RodZ
MTDKSAAVLPMTPRSPLASQKAGTMPPRIEPAKFGERLRRGREEKKLSLQEIADTTKIGMQQLRALERGDLQRLPAGIYRRAMVRQYAEAVGLNVEETLRDLASVSTDVDIDLHKLEEGHHRGDAGSSPLTTALWSSAAALVALGAVAAVATAWYRTGVTRPAADAPVAAASAPTSDADAPAIASVAATEAVRANARDIDLATEADIQVATEPDIQLATEPAVVRTGTGRVIDSDATEGELRITSEPAGAQVTVNGIGWGVTPVTIRYMPFGKKLIRATKPGYVSAQRGLDFVPDGLVKSVRIQLAPESPEAR